MFQRCGFVHERRVSSGVFVGYVFRSWRRTERMRMADGFFFFFNFLSRPLNNEWRCTRNGGLDVCFLDRFARTSRALFFDNGLIGNRLQMTRRKPINDLIKRGRRACKRFSDEKHAVSVGPVIYRFFVALRAERIFR